MKPVFETTHRISSQLSEAYRGKISRLDGAVIATAYVLAKMQQNPSACNDSLESFLSDINEDKEVASVLSRNLAGLWEIVISFKNKFETEYLIDLVKHDNSFFKESTPGCLMKLSAELLDLNEQDEVLELCSGCASFPSYLQLDGKNFRSYTGIEINYNLNDVAVLRTSLLDGNYKLNIGNVLTSDYSRSYDKIFSEHPLGMRGPDVDEARVKLQEKYNINASSVSRSSADWIFGSIIKENLTMNGKGIAFIANGSAYNKPDTGMRQQFVENGCINAAVNLAPLLPETMIPITMLVFSHNNKSVRLVNAESIVTKNGRINTLTDEDIQKILDCIENGGDNTIDLTPEEMRNHDYNLLASHYLDKPVIENGVSFESVIKSVVRGAQVKPDVLESYKSVLPTAYRYIALSNVSNGCVDIEEGKQYISELPKSLAKFVVPANAIVLSKMASPTFRSAVVSETKNQSIVATGNLYIIEIDESKANPYYIQAFFDSEAGESTLNYASTGSAVRTLSTEAVKEIIIPLPSLDEQNEIAVKYQAALDEYAILKRKTQRVLERKRTLLNGQG